jgi:hypothetical protein
MRNFDHGGIERRFIGAGWFSIAAHFADKLQRRGRYFLFGGALGRSPQDFDAPAHDL